MASKDQLLTIAIPGSLITDIQCNFTFPPKPQITSQSENSNLILNTKETCRVSM